MPKAGLHLVDTGDETALFDRDGAPIAPRADAVVEASFNRLLERARARGEARVS